MRLIYSTFFSLVGALALHAQSALPKPTAAAAPLNLVVFSDFQCPYSADLYFSLQRYQKTHPGALNVIFKQSPLAIHPDSPLAHRAALAAGRQGQFDAMATLLFANQQHQDRASLLADARQLHLDLARFRRDLDSPAIQAQLDADTNEAAAFGIDSTPTVYVRGKPLIGDLEEAKLDVFLTGVPTSANASASPATEANPALDHATTAELELHPAAEQGTPGAPLTIVEFTDFQCPYCRAAALPLEQFVAAHPHDVHLVVHSFPLDFHPDSELANEAALAAGEQGKFWPMHDLLFAHQDDLKPASLRKYAESLQLDMATFDAALSSHRMAGSIAADRALGLRAGVDGTPTFFIDGHPMNGARSTTEWEQLLALHHLPAAGQTSVVATQTPTTPHLVTGSSAAALTLTWYTDVRSPLARAQAELVRSLAKRYDGKVRVLFKACPLAMHPDAALASAALIAATAQNKFWPMYDALTAHQPALDRAAVLSLADGLQIDAASFAAALDAAVPAVQADVNEAQRRGILGAPVIFVNDQRVDGLQHEAFYTKIADAELAQVVAEAGEPTSAPPAAN